MHSVACVGNFRFVFLLRCLEVLKVLVTLKNNNHLGCLISIFENWLIHMRFSRYILTEDLSVIRNLKFFKSLITGKTSYHNSTALLIGLTAESPGLCVCIYMKFGSESALSHKRTSFSRSTKRVTIKAAKENLHFFYSLAATYSPTPSPVQYHRPPRS